MRREKLSERSVRYRATKRKNEMATDHEMEEHYRRDKKIVSRVNGDEVMKTN